MKKSLLIVVMLLNVSYWSFSQGVGIGTTSPDVSAALDVTATNKGLLIPRMNLPSILGIASPARGLMVYDSVVNQLMVNMGTPAAPNWQPIVTSNSGWSLTGNIGINPANQFIGTTDNQPLRFRVNNIQAGEIHPATGNISWGLGANKLNTTGFSNIAIGTDALKFNVTGANLVAIGDSALFNNDKNNPVPGALAIANTAIGSKSLFSNTIGSGNTATGRNSLFSNTEGSDNTAYGTAALFSNTIGGLNTAIGNQALFSNTTGNLNTAAGWESLRSNTTGVFNAALGSFSLRSNTTGENNTAAGFASLNSNTAGKENTGIGIRALFSNTTGNDNTATGSRSLFSNTTGFSNTATGNQSLFFNTTGIGNTAVGSGSLFSNTTGGVNTAIGDLSLNSNTVGNSNTAIGVQSLFLNLNGISNTAVGGNALGATISAANNTAVGHNAAFNFNMGSNNTLIGADADASQDGLANATALGAGAVVNASNKVRIGNSAVTVIEGQVPFTTPSDGRFKFQVQEDVKGLNFIMQLHPVTYLFDVKRFDQQQTNTKDKSGIGASYIKHVSYDEAASIRRTGFIAQEVERAANNSGYDFSGIIKPKTEQDHYSLSYESFVVPLVKAVQEQQQIIEGLKKQNESLQKRVLDLENKVRH